MLDALKHTVTSIVLKVLGSSGADAYRFLAASVIKAGKNLIPVIFAPTGMLSASWTFLMPYAIPIIAAAVMIIAAMRKRNKTMLGSNLLVIGETSDVMRSIGTAHLRVTTRETMKTELQNSAKRLIAASQFGFRKMFGVAFTDDDEPVMVLDLNNPNIPIVVTGDAIEELFGGKFSMILESLTPAF